MSNLSIWGVPKSHRRAAHEKTCKCEGWGKKGASPLALPLMVAKTPLTHALSWLALLPIIGELVHRLVLSHQNRANYIFIYGITFAWDSLLPCRVKLKKQFMNIKFNLQLRTKKGQLAGLSWLSSRVLFTYH